MKIALITNKGKDKKEKIKKEKESKKKETKNVEIEVQIVNISLTHCPFWVRLYNLPMGSRTESRIKLIGGGLGHVMEVDYDGIGWDKSARLKVMLDVTKPLRRIQQIRSKEGNVAVIEIKYERLPDFCYVCGKLGHIERDCLSLSEEDRDEDKQWGSWLRASPRRGRIKMAEEVKVFRSCARVLSYSPTGLNSKNDAGNVSKDATSIPITESEQTSSREPEICHEHDSLGKSLPTNMKSLTVKSNAEHVEHDMSFLNTMNVVLNEPHITASQANKCEGQDLVSGKEHNLRELSEGVSKCAREIEGLPPKCVRELGTLGGESDAPQMSQVVDVSSMDTLPISFTIGTGGNVGKKTKKVTKKHYPGRACHEKKETQGLYGGKRKNMCSDSEMDGEDIRMIEMDTREKKTKLNSEIIDGNIISLTVAEVGISQPREGQ